MDDEQRAGFRREADQQTYTTAVKAMEIAMATQNKIAMHEAVCEFRQKEIVTKLDLLYRILLLGTAGLITSLGVVAWSLLEHSINK